MNIEIINPITVAIEEKYFRGIGKNIINREIIIINGTAITASQKFAYYEAGGDIMAYSITVNVSEKKLTLLREGSPVKSYPIGVGKMLTPTPTGTYSIINKEPNPGGPFGVMWMGLSKPHYGIHGTNDPSSIGKVVSHGCIRMYNKDVLELSRTVPIGTLVTIIG